MLFYSIQFTIFHALYYIPHQVNKTKGEYHAACKNERSAQNQERNAGGDPTLSPDQVNGGRGRWAIVIDGIKKED